MTDRDTFAAAALTGLLAKSIAPEQAMSQYVRIAGEYADAMLRERERVTEPLPKEKRAEVSDTHHDAAPASRPPETRASGVAIAQAWSCDLRRFVTADEEQRMANHDAAPTIESALETLSRAIGVYGKRIDSPFSIRWSNGITAFLNGTFVAGGRGNVARAIAEHGMPDMSKNDATNHDAVPEAKARTDSATGEPGGGGGCGGTDKPVTLPATGTGDIPCSRTRDIVARLRKWCHAVDAESAQDLMDEAATEIERLCEAIRRLAAQDATLSVQGGNVTVTMDATLTDEEREAIEWATYAAEKFYEHATAATLRSLLERLK